MHQSGKVTLTYDSLPKEISEQCGYNEETAEYEVKRRAEEAKGRNSSTRRTSANRSVASSSQPRTTESTANDSNDVGEPKGAISTKVTRTYNQNGKTYKDIVVTVRSNVYARLLLNPGADINIAPNATQSFDMVSKPGGDYSIQLVSLKGNVLASKVSTKRKIGL